MNDLLLLLNPTLRVIARTWMLAVLPTLFASSLLAQGGEAVLGANPFGFQCGMTAEQVKGMAGKSTLEEPLGGLKKLELTTAPHPHSAFVSYSLIVTPEQGVVMINAKGFNPGSSSAAELRDVFADIQGALSRIYGKPTQNLDLSGDDAFWIVGQTAVSSSPRHWAAVWDVTRPSRNHLQSIILNAEQASNYFFLSYECDGIEGISDSTKAAVLDQTSAPTAFLPTARRSTPKANAVVTATPTSITPRTGHQIQYKVEGSYTKIASLTYRNATGGTDQITVALPWTLTFTALPGQFVYLSAQNKQDYGSIECFIYLDDVPVKRAVANTEYGIATVSGNVPADQDK